MKTAPATLLQAVILALVVVLLIAEAAVYVPPLKQSQTLSVSIQLSSGGAVVSSALSTSFSGTFRQVVEWVNESNSIRTIYYYYDRAYPISWSNGVGWYGVPLYLKLIASLRGVSTSIVVVNAVELAEVLTNTTTTNDSLLVMTSGVFPSTVYSTSTDLVHPWLREGGRMIWIGDAIGAYSGEANEPLTHDNDTLGRNGTIAFLGLDKLGGPSSYDNPTPLSSASNFDWLTVPIRGFGVNVTELATHGGIVEGNLLDGYTNGGLIPVGSGELLDFASPLVINFEERVALGIMNLVELGFLYPSTQLASLTNASVGPGMSWTHTVFVKPTGLALTSSWDVCVFTEQVDVSALFASQTCQDAIG